VPLRANSIPVVLRPYRFHGTEFSRIGQEEACGACPFCGREEKFYVDCVTGKWWCHVCQVKPTIKASDPVIAFLNQLWIESDKATVSYDEIRKDRRLLSDETLIAWGVTKSVSTGFWLVPAYDTQNKDRIRQLYSFHVQGSRKLLATPTLEHGLFGVNLYDPSKRRVYLCEGPWDAMTLYEVLEETGELEDVNVLAVPGCSTFKKNWLHFFKGKDVYILFDNDHPKVNPRTKTTVPPAGFTGVKRVCFLLKDTADSVSWLAWGNLGYTKKLPSGYDLRDALSGKTIDERVKAWLSLKKRFKPARESWYKDPSVTAAGLDAGTSETIPCDSYERLRAAWQRALKWTYGLDCALTAMLASVVSVSIPGPPIWLRIVGPPGCGKSTLCEALSTNKRHVIAQSAFTGFHSGFRGSDGNGNDDDSSIVPRIDGKVLIVKDADPIIQSPRRAVIFAEARDLYDGFSRVFYRNRVVREYKGIRFSWILCGTKKIRDLDSAELGERFLDCIIVDESTLSERLDVIMSAINRVSGDLASTNGRVLSDGRNRDIVYAQQLTGGYIEYLKKNADEMRRRIGELSDEAKQLMCAIGLFVSLLRLGSKRPRGEYTGLEMETGTRPGEQHAALAVALAIVLGKDKIDDEVLRRVVKIALDTGRGYALSVIEALDRHPHGLTLRTLSFDIGLNSSDTYRLLTILRRNGAVTRCGDKWVLTKALRSVYSKIKRYADREA